MAIEKKTSVLPEHTLKDMRSTVRKAAATLASAAGTSPQPETAERKLAKYGGNRDRLTPAQARRLRKTERRG